MTYEQNEPNVTGRNTAQQPLWHACWMTIRQKSERQEDVPEASMEVELWAKEADCKERSLECCRDLNVD